MDPQSVPLGFHPAGRFPFPDHLLRHTRQEFLLVSLIKSRLFNAKGGPAIIQRARLTDRVVFSLARVFPIPHS
jgi:hypothetical protein